MLGHSKHQHNRQSVGHFLQEDSSHWPVPCFALYAMFPTSSFNFGFVNFGIALEFLDPRVVLPGGKVTHR